MRIQPFFNRRVIMFELVDSNDDFSFIDFVGDWIVYEDVLRTWRSNSLGVYKT